MNQPRLLPDYAAVPTRREKAAARAYAASLQRSMFELAELDYPPCAACTSTEHRTDRCPLGIALTLDTNNG